MDYAFNHTDLVLEQMSSTNWIVDYGENIKDTVLNDLR